MLERMRLFSKDKINLADNIWKQEQNKTIVKWSASSNQVAENKLSNNRIRGKPDLQKVQNQTNVPS